MGITTDMDLLVTLAIYVAVLLVLLFSGMPVVFALGILAVGSLYIGFGSEGLPMLGNVAWHGLASFVLIACPLFVFMGFVLFESGLSMRVYGGIKPLLDRLLPGGLLHSNIVAAACFAACCGSTMATCATVGAVALPEMEKRGYNRSIAAGSIAAGGTLGPIIPPSLDFIIIGAMTNTSIGRLFIGGIIPGLVLASLYMGYIGIRVRIQPHLVRGDIEAQKLPWKTCLLSLLQVWPVILLILGVIGSIYGGVATASEAAGVGCALSLVIAACYRSLNWDVLKRAVARAVETTSLILVIYTSAVLMSVYLSNAGITMRLANLVGGLPLPPLGVFVAIVVMYLIMGMLMDGLALLVVTLPVIYPIAMELGFDPIWFGVELCMITECAVLTPPVGINLFILQGLRPEYPFMDIVKGAMPFFLALLIGIALVALFPQLATFLPQTMMGS